MRTVRGMMYTERFCFEPGEITLEGEKISKIALCGVEELTPEETGRYILPGLVDTHFHGCAGYDFCDGTVEAMRTIAEYEVTHGTTTICPATMTLSEETLMQICGVCAEAVETERVCGDLPLKDILRGIYLLHCAIGG